MKKIFLIITAAIGFVSCETEYLPKDVLAADTVYTTVADLQSGLNSVFDRYNTYPIIAFNSTFTDECKIGADSGGQNVTLYNMQVTPSANANLIWTEHYRTINFANKIIDAAASVPAITPADNANKNNIIGQCIALRALCHLDLLAHYATTMEDPSALGVIYLDFVPLATAELPRNTVGECFTKLVEDLDTAQGLISNTNKIFITTDAITFMRAKVALFTGDNQSAITYANSLISGYSLASGTQYQAMFADTDNTEVIFKAERKPNNGHNTTVFPSASIGGIWYFTGTGGAFMEMSNSVYESMDKTVIDPADPNSAFVDVRSSVLFWRAESDPSANLHLIGKYQGSEGVPYLNDVKLMRISEMYLVKAEAQAKLSQFTAAAETMQTYVNARYVTGFAPVKSYTNLQNTIIDILEERKLELGYEGHRYVDIKRLRSISNVGIERNSLDCGGAAPCGLAPSDALFTLPIPLSEINSNRAMVQNPGFN